MSSSGQDPAPGAIARAYHQRTKHRFEAYAEGPGQLDWAAQPEPFRHFLGAPQLDLPLSAADFDRPWRDLGAPSATPAVPGCAAVGALFQLALGITAWKTWGPSRWALRANPSSGNLHPVEAYLFSGGVVGIPDGLHHYDPRDHRLEHRAVWPGAGDGPWLAIGLTSIMWREAWKYGERAFRYCQHDTGHAVGALAYAAALLGWRLRPLAATGDQLGHWLGVDRSDDFPAGRYRFTETEEPEILLALAGPDLAAPPASRFPARAESAHWQGKATTIDAAPGYRWPVIDQMAAASADTAARPASPAALPPLPPLPPHPAAVSAATVILQRRSAQGFDPRPPLPRTTFYRLLDALLPRPAAPWDALGGAPRIHLALFVLRVHGLPSGLYLLPRSEAGAAGLADALQPADGRFAQRRPVMEFDSDCPAHLGLELLAELPLQELQRIARAVSCHQDIAATSAFSLGMLGEFDAALAGGDHGYRQLLRESGVVGQTLYLEAEAAGVRGTGIGCFFDDPVHQVFGLADSRFQSVYHFTVGTPVVDARIETGPPYPQRFQENP